MSIPPSLNSPAFHHHYPNGTTPLVSPSHSIAFSDATSKMDSYPFNDYPNTEQLNTQWYGQEFGLGSGVLQPHSQPSGVDHHNHIPEGQYNTQSIQQQQQQRQQHAIAPPGSWAISSADTQNATIWQQEQQQHLYATQIQNNRHNTMSTNSMALDHQLEQHFNVARNKFIPSPALQSPNILHQQRPNLSHIRHQSANSASSISQLTQTIPSPSQSSHTGSMAATLLDNLSSPPQSMLKPPSRPAVRRTKPPNTQRPAPTRTASTPLPPIGTMSQSSLSTPAAHPSTTQQPSAAETDDPPAATLFPKRKRGRPRLQRGPSSPTSLPITTTARTTTTTSSAASKARSSNNNSVSVSKPSRRQPHNMVERKYREGLNNEMERLRAALPHLHRGRGGKVQQPSSSTRRDGRVRVKQEEGVVSYDDEEEEDDGDEDMTDGDEECEGGNGKGAANNNQRPSKAIVLQSAVEEIERLRGENSKLKGELERLEGERARWKVEEMSGMGFGGRR